MNDKEIFIFGKPGCPKCASTKSMMAVKLPKWGVAADVTFFNTDDPQGRARAAFYDVLEIPTTIVFLNGKEAARFVHQVPPSDGLKAALGVTTNDSLPQSSGPS